MKTSKVTKAQQSAIEIERKLERYAKMNLFTKKFNESTAILLRAKLSFN